MAEFNAKSARAKRPLPLWADAFHRDTQDLSAEEVGAYFLILMAMWARENCDLPDDDKRLARICRVSPTLWKRRMGPLMRGFFEASDGIIFSERLKKEAKFVELSVTQQSKRKNGKSTCNTLKNNDTPLSADHPWIDGGSTVDHPTYNPTTQHIKTHDDSSASIEVFHPREVVLEAMGIDRSGVLGPTGKIIGTPADMAILNQWMALPAMNLDQVCAVIREVMAKKRDGPPTTFKYFNRAMQERSGALTQPALEPIQTKGRTNGISAREQFDVAHREYANRIRKGEIDFGPDPSDPWA